MSQCDNCGHNLERQGICPDCSGSGEGGWDGSVCRRCYGTGTINSAPYCPYCDDPDEQEEHDDVS